MLHKPFNPPSNFRRYAEYPHFTGEEMVGKMPSFPQPARDGMKVGILTSWSGYPTFLTGCVSWGSLWMPETLLCESTSLKQVLLSAFQTATPFHVYSLERNCHALKKILLLLPSSEWQEIRRIEGCYPFSPKLRLSKGDDRMRHAIGRSLLWPSIL